MDNNQIIIYQAGDDQTQIDVRLENETVWLTTQQMAMLFDREESNIRRHVINVFKEGELKKENNVHFLHVNGVKKPVPFYNLDVIISVGYRVKSQRGVQFRQCANRVLKQYLIKGYAINERLRHLDIYGVAEAYRGPVRIIHGSDDTLVPMWCSEDYKRIYGDNAELIVVENENHRISRKTKQVAVLVADFFKGCCSRGVFVEQQRD